MKMKIYCMFCTSMMKNALGCKASRSSVQIGSSLKLPLVATTGTEFGHQ